MLGAVLHNTGQMIVARLVAGMERFAVQALCFIKIRYLLFCILDFIIKAQTESIYHEHGGLPVIVLLCPKESRC